MAETLGEVNPLRYRGYVYDTDTQLYYLQSRYYDPEIGRFLNADTYTSTGQGLLGNNMFAYCGNNPANRADPSGTMPSYIFFDENRTSFGNPLGCGGGGGGGLAFAYYVEERKDVEDQFNKLVYIPNSDGSGAHISNSHQVRNVILMFIYVNEHRGEEIHGTTNAVVVEWVAHNAAYDFYSLVGNEKKAERAGHLDVGNTIWDDDHQALTGLMLFVHFELSPISYIYDSVVALMKG